MQTYLHTLAASAFANGPLILLNVKETCHRLAISEVSLRRYSKSLPRLPAEGSNRTPPRRLSAKRSRRMDEARWACSIISCRNRSVIRSLTNNL